LSRVSASFRTVVPIQREILFSLLTFMRESGGKPSHSFNGTGHGSFLENVQVQPGTASGRLVQMRKGTWLQPGR
jgi:hypothetical protein